MSCTCGAPVHQCKTGDKGCLHCDACGAAASKPYRVRDRLTRARYYFDTRAQCLAFVDDVSTSEITGEPLARWQARLVVERNS